MPSGPRSTCPAAVLPSSPPATMFSINVSTCRDDMTSSTALQPIPAAAGAAMLGHWLEVEASAIPRKIGSSPPMAFSSSAPSTAAYVLTQPSLFANITSFQFGVPGVAVPLLRLFKADGYVKFDAARRVFSTRLMEETPVVDEWPIHTMAEAVGCYNDRETLAAIWRIYTTRGEPLEEKTQFMERLAEAAAAYGHLDLLQWCLLTQNDVELHFSTKSFCVRSGAFHGHLHIVEWLLEEYPDHVRGLLGEMNCIEVVKRGHESVLDWLLGRELGRFPPDVLLVALQSGRLNIVQTLCRHMPRALYDEGSMVRVAVTNGHQSIVEWLVRDRKTSFSMGLVTNALANDHVGIARVLMENRKNVSSPADGSLDMTRLLVQLVTNNKLQAIEFLLSTVEKPSAAMSVRACVRTQHTLEAVKLLLPVSPRGHVLSTVVQLTMAEKSPETVDYILKHAPEPVPPAVVGFVERARSGRLGLLSTLVLSSIRVRGTNYMDRSKYHEHLPRAPGDDLRDAALVTCLSDHEVMEEVLMIDLHNRRPVEIDVPLLEACRDICESAVGHFDLTFLLTHIEWRQNLRP